MEEIFKEMGKVHIKKTRNEEVHTHCTCTYRNTLKSLIPFKQRLLNSDDEVKQNVGKRKMNIKMDTERKKRKPGNYL